MASQVLRIKLQVLFMAYKALEDLGPAISTSLSSITLSLVDPTTLAFILLLLSLSVSLYSLNLYLEYCLSRIFFPQIYFQIWIPMSSSNRLFLTSHPTISLHPWSYFSIWFSLSYSTYHYLELLDICIYLLSYCLFLLTRM